MKLKPGDHTDQSADRNAHMIENSGLTRMLVQDNLSNRFDAFF